MAAPRKKSSTKSKAGASIKPGDQKFVESLAAFIGADTDGDYLYIVPSAMKATVLENGGNYKHHPFTGGEELLLSGARCGARGQIIFHLDPIDDRPFTRVEIDDKKIFDIFPDLIEVVAQAVIHEIRSNEMKEIKRLDEYPPAAAHDFHRYENLWNATGHGNALNEMKKDFLEHLALQEKAEKEKEAVSTAASNEELFEVNEEYGMF